MTIREDIRAEVTRQFRSEGAQRMNTRQCARAGDAMMRGLVEGLSAPPTYREAVHLIHAGETIWTGPLTREQAIDWAMIHVTPGASREVVTALYDGVPVPVPAVALDADALPWPLRRALLVLESVKLVGRALLRGLKRKERRS